jgi:hypothetical protein
MVLIFVFAGFLIAVCLFALAMAGIALCVMLKLLEWTLRLILWSLNRYAGPQPGDSDIVINIVVDDESPPMCDVTRRRKMLL